MFNLYSVTFWACFINWMQVNQLFWGGYLLVFPLAPSYLQWPFASLPSSYESHQDTLRWFNTCTLKYAHTVKATPCLRNCNQIKLVIAKWIAVAKKSKSDYLSPVNKSGTYGQSAPRPPRSAIRPSYVDVPDAISNPSLKQTKAIGNLILYLPI